MNAKLLITAISLGAALPLVADSTNMLATTAAKTVAVKIEKTAVHVPKPFATTPGEDKTKVTRVENMSSRPWTEIVGWRQVQFASDADRYHEPQFTLLWIGNEPQPWTLDR